MTIARTGSSELSTDRAQTINVTKTKGSGALFGWADRIFGNTGVLHRIILTGSGVFILGIFYRNIAPYSALMARIFSDGGGAPSILNTITGTLFFAAIQAAEILPLAVPRSSSAIYQFAQFVSLAAFTIDVIACFAHFPPIAVSINIFRFAPSITMVSWANIVLMVVTVFGGTAWMMLRNGFAASYANKGGR